MQYYAPAVHSLSCSATAACRSAGVQFVSRQSVASAWNCGDEHTQLTFVLLLKSQPRHRTSTSA